MSFSAEYEFSGSIRVLPDREGLPVGIFDKLKKSESDDIDNETNEWLTTVVEDNSIERRTQVLEGDIHEHGPTGPAAIAALETLGLLDGCSWADVVDARNQFVMDDPELASAEQRHAWTEANLAYASLRLLRAERRREHLLN